MKKHKQLIIIPLIALVLSLTACSSEDKIVQKTEFPQSHIIETGILRTQIIEVYKTFSTNPFMLDDGYLYVVVKMTIENMSDEKQSISTYDWKMQNGDGVEVSPSWDSKLGSESLSAELLPGGSLTAELYYELPINNSNLKLAYYSNMFNSKPSFKYLIECACSSPALTKQVYTTSEIVTYNDVEYSVLTVKRSKGSGYTTPSKGNVFVGVNLNTKNLSRDTISISDYNWKLVDGNGVQYSTTYGQPFGDHNYPYTDLMSGGNVAGYLVYEVPSSATLTLQFYSGISRDVLVFGFQLK